MLKKLSIMICYFFLLLVEPVFSEDDFNYTYITLSSVNNKGYISASFFVEDSNGRKTGENPILKELYSEIPNARFGDEGYGDDLSTESGIYRIIFDAENMIDGVYYINVIGTGTDSIRLGIVVERKKSKKYEFQSIGLIHKGEIKKFQLNYASDPSVPITVEEVTAIDPISTINELITYIHTALNLGSIDNKGLANSLISKLETAKKQIEKEKPKEAVNALRAFLNELEAQHGKHIADEVYVYLKEKVKGLMVELEVR